MENEQPHVHADGETHDHAHGHDHAHPHEPAAAPASPKAKDPMTNGRRILIGFLAALGIALVGSVASAYVLPPTHPFVRQVAAVLPLPAAVVGTDAVSIEDFLVERDALTTYFAKNQQAQAPASEADLDKQVLDTLVNKKALEALAKARGIKVDSAKADALEKQMQGTSDQATFDAQIKTQFGWSADQFRERVVNSLELANAMTDALNADEAAQKGPHDAATAALARLDKGEDFAAVAKDTSKDASAAQGGDIGYQAESSLPPDIVSAVATLKKGAHTGVIESPGAFLIVQFNDRVKAKDGTEDKLSVIVIPKKSLQDAVDGYLAGTRVWRLIVRK
jgi:hypothetical protein